MYLQKIRNSSLSCFDEKREFLNEIEDIPWI